jgi:hypothetical protein
MTLAEDFSESVWATVRLMSDAGLTRLEVAQDLDQRRLDGDGSGRMSQAPPRSITARSKRDLKLTPYVRGTEHGQRSTAHHPSCCRTDRLGQADGIVGSHGEGSAGGRA